MKKRVGLANCLLPPAELADWPLRRGAHRFRNDRMRCELLAATQSIKVPTIVLISRIGFVR
jgi:hypothetical protein